MSDDDALEELLPDGREALETVTETLAEVDAVSELEGDELESLRTDVRTLIRIVDETEDLLEAVDLTQLPDAVDAGEVLDAVDADEIPDALAGGDVGDAVSVRKLVEAIDLLEAWDATDLGDLWEEKRELEDAVDDLDDDGGDGSVVGELASEAVEEGEELLESGGDLSTEDAKQVLGDIDVMEDPEAYQIAIQQTAIEGIDAFRAALLETHAKLERLVEKNREKTRYRDRSPNSRNPTAVSTISSQNPAVSSVVNHSTVPQQVRHSTAPGRRRIYGPRFEQERNRGDETDE